MHGTAQLTSVQQTEFSNYPNHGLAPYRVTPYIRFSQIN